MKRNKCEECSGKILRKNIDFKLYGVSLGMFPADVCIKCGEEVFNEETSDKIDELAKKKGLWGLSATTTVGKCGNTLDIRLNKKIASFMHLEKGIEVTIVPENKKRLIMEIQK